MKQNNKPKDKKTQKFNMSESWFFEMLGNKTIQILCADGEQS